MIKEYQVTLKSVTGKYKPVSCIVKCEELDLTKKEDRKNLITKGTQKICAKRYWGKKELLNGGYTKAIVREYDKEAIAAAAKANYEAIKEAKYNSGEWKRPTTKE